MRLICIQVTVYNMVTLNQNITIHINFSLFFICLKNLRLSNFSPDLRKMMDGAKFNSHDSDSHFKKLTSINRIGKRIKANAYFFVNKLVS